jgi:glucokinase
MLPSLSGFPLCDLLEARYQLPTHLHVDVDAAVLAEHRFGAGKGLRRLLLLSMNAVVGASLVVDGQVEHSAQRYVGHICHFPVSTSGSRCGCGKRGCVNTFLSLDALQKMMQRALRRGDESSLTRRLLNHEYFSPQLLAEEAERGDSVALTIYDELARWLSVAVARYVSLFEPNMLILGGDMLCDSELILSRVRDALIILPSSQVYNTVELVPACLGSDAELVGAVLSLFDQNCSVRFANYAAGQYTL